MTVTVVVGGFYGDEGKGKIVAYLSLSDSHSLAVRGGVGPNAGHTVLYKDQVLKLRMLPSAVVNKSTRLLIGPGVLIDPVVILHEATKYNALDRLVIDRSCGIIEPNHINSDKSGFLASKVGSTGSGTGPANAERVLRTAKLARDLDIFEDYLDDIPGIVNSQIENGNDVLVEGTQGTFLSLYFGDYPFVTSKDVTASAICSDVGLGPKKVDDVMVVFKSYVTRVGEGPFAGEISASEIKKLGWSETGTVTGRTRRAAPFDFNLARRSIMLNSATSIAITKLDILFPSATGIRKYDELSSDAQAFIENIENELNTSVSIIGTGAEVFDTIDRR
ncbi:MAG TPA: adenylosuccinate synthetase [Candidatus Marinimicrobia bacterium]|nr:adenylosuccinate synthetase [Candidatus Neomarinimicrobiota bacterium]